MSQNEFSQALDRLTTQQWEVLSRVLAGEPDSEIAATLGIKPATVRKHVERIYRVFDISSEPDDRRSKRVDLFALFAKYKPELLGTGTAVTIEKVIDAESLPKARLPNPFIPLNGVVDDPQLFFNREREIRRVLEALNSGSSVAVIGERAIGKSSLLLAILRRAESQLIQQRQPVYLNLQPLESEDDFYSALCDEVKIDEKSRGYQLVRALRKRPLLLALDEVENETVLTSDIRSQLRGLAEGSDAPLRLLLAASQPLDSIFNDEGMTSPLAGICIEENIGFWDQTTVRAFITSRLQSTPVTFSEEEISQILQESGGHPQKLVQRCHETYAQYIEARQ